MKRETKRIEQLLANAKASRDLVRSEMKETGASLQHVYDELGNHELQFRNRLKDLQEWNAAQGKSASSSEAADPTDMPPEPKKKAK